MASGFPACLDIPDAAQAQRTPASQTSLHTMNIQSVQNPKKSGTT